MSEAARESCLRPAVFLDRDGTLIDNPGDLGDPEQVKLLPGVPEALKILLENHFKLIVVTNQGGVARGKYSEDAVALVHARIEQMLRAQLRLPAVIDGFYFCPFHPLATLEHYKREHPWRKPAPGMLLAAALEHAIDLPRSWMVGDQERDVAAGAAAGCRTLLLSVNREHSAASAADFVEADLLHAARRIAAGEIESPSRGTIALHARRSDILADADFQTAIASMARELASRTGIRLVRLDFQSSSVAATVEGGDVIALGFVAELRRDSERWWRTHRAAESPWGSW
ncbi:MAG: HAD family hydrolase [Planctomycetes bacterium]|nr:HAD family hydrolase [Planctomycetota bacterium]